MRRAVLRVLLAVVAMLSLGPPALVAPARADGVVKVLFASVEPAALGPGVPLTVSVRVRNEGPQLDGASVELRLRPTVISTPEGIDDWQQGQAHAGTVLATMALPPTATGTTVPVTLSVAPGQVPLPNDQDRWGPRGIEVAVTGNGTTFGSGRTFVVWHPGTGGYEPTRTAMLIPITDGPPSTATGMPPAAQLSAAAAPGGRLSDLLQIASRPGVSWAVDPALLDERVQDPVKASDATATATKSTATATTEPGQAETYGRPGRTDTTSRPLQTWRAELRRAAADRDVLSLPYGDPDLVSAAHAGAQDWVGFSRLQATQVLGDSVPGIRHDILWPAGSQADTATLSKQPDLRGYILSTDTVPLFPGFDSISGRVSVNGSNGPVDAALSNAILDRALEQVGGESDGSAVQTLRAFTAAVTKDGASSSWPLLASAPRGWDPGTAAGIRAVESLTALPWVSAAGVGEIFSEGSLKAPAPATPRNPRYSARGELPSAQLADARTDMDRLDLASRVLPRPLERSWGVRQRAAAALSCGWRSQPEAWRAALGALHRDAEWAARAVGVRGGGNVNVVSSEVNLPVTVTNDHDAEVNVVVRLRPSSNRLVATEPVRAAIGPRSARVIQIPVRAVGNGDTSVQVELLTPDGLPLTAPVRMPVQVRADWENWTIGGLTVAVGALAVIGVIRGIRRGERRRDVDDPLDALSGDTSGQDATAG